MELSPEQKEIVAHRGTPVRVVACAGSGKTEAISRRVAGLITEGCSPESLVAFTFTDRAAVELKERIYRRVEEGLGRDFLGKLGPMFVGTIHGYCFRVLQEYVPKYGNYDILDEHRHAGLLSREYYHLGLSKLGSRHWEPVRDFSHTADLISNELVDSESLDGTAIGECYQSYLQMLERYRFLTYGQLVAKTVDVLKDPTVKARVHGRLRHLVVDEYQDINPAQERLINLLAAPPVQLCVVGDDDQAIYQWRGSDIQNILHFTQRYPGARTIKLEINRRSRPAIIEATNRFAQAIPDRLDKVMRPVRESVSPSVVPWSAETDEAEAAQIAETIQKLHQQGFRYRDIAIFYRSVKTSAPVLVEQLEARGIPYQCGGRTGLFLEPEINVMGEVFAWFVDGAWKDARFGPQRVADLDHIVEELTNYFGLQAERQALKQYLLDWRAIRLRSNRPVSLVGDYYRLLDRLGVQRIDPESPEGAARLGSLARFSTLLADFEHVTQRGRYVTNDAGVREFRGGQDRGKPYYQRLHNYLLHYARDAYEDFEGEQTRDVDAVDILTVHQAKGLEWPVVFLPSLTHQRFPSKFAGAEQDWLLPEAVFPRSTQLRYQGGDAEERRLFYVAMTRARDALYLSCFERKQRAVKPSPYLLEIAGGNDGLRRYAELPLPPPDMPAEKKEPAKLEISFSDVALFEDCGYRFRLARMLGFEQELAIELGYGKAIHHVLRQIAEHGMAHGCAPGEAEARGILEDEFYLPFADHPTFNRMLNAASWVVNRYLREYAEDLKRVFAIERPFEVNLPDGILLGKADIILDRQEGRPDRLAIVDYKTSKDPLRDARYALQLAVYAAAGRGEGLEVVAGYLHDLDDGERRPVSIDDQATAEATKLLSAAVKKIRSGAFQPCAEADACARCDYRHVCRHSRAPANSDAIGEKSEQPNWTSLQGNVIRHLIQRSGANA